MQIFRAETATHVNAILNHPEVRPDVAPGDAEIDVTSHMSLPGCLVLAGEHGAFLLFKIDTGIYETHTFILPSGRGLWAREFAAAGASWMFINTDAYDLTTRVPLGHVAAKALAMGAGMRWEFTRYPGVEFRGRVTPMATYGMRIQDWAARASGFNEAGHAFHEHLREEAARCGVKVPPHPDDDPDHDRYVGIAFAMIVAGEVGKGVAFYNRWAALARHSRVQWIGVDPVAIRIDTGILTLADGRISLSVSE